MSIVATVIGFFILIFRKRMKNKVSPKCKVIIWVIFIIFLIFSVLNCINVSFKENDLEKQTIRKNDFYHENEVVKIFLNDFKKDKNYLFSILTNIFFKLFIVVSIISVLFYIITNLLFYHESLQDERIESIVNRCKEKLHIKKKIRLIYQEIQDSPAIVGILNVKILFSDIIFSLTDRELECVIMHELSHYKRKDNLMCFIINYLKILYLFNPIIGKLLNCMRIDVEIATDNLAINKIENMNRQEYCNVLIKMKKLCKSKSKFGFGLVNKKSDLSYRISAIADEEKSKKYNIFIVAFISILIIFMLVIFYPISYAKAEMPKLYLKLENGTIIDIEKENYIRLSSGTSISISADSNKNIESIFYEKNNVNGEEYYFRYIKLDKKIYYKSGEYSSKITVNYKNGDSRSYNFKVCVE